MSRFARGLSSGDRISQGEIIGYVGMTGLATGPHLHYEYLSRGVHMDPQKVALPTDIPVPPAQMARFREAAAPLLVSLATGDVSALVAAQVPVETPNPATAATKGAL